MLDRQREFERRQQSKQQKQGTGIKVSPRDLVETSVKTPEKKQFDMTGFVTDIMGDTTYIYNPEAIKRIKKSWKGFEDDSRYTSEEMEQMFGPDWKSYPSCVKCPELEFTGHEGNANFMLMSAMRITDAEARVRAKEGFARNKQRRIERENQEQLVREQRELEENSIHVVFDAGQERRSNRDDDYKKFGLTRRRKMTQQQVDKLNKDLEFKYTSYLTVFLLVLTNVETATPWIGVFVTGTIMKLCYAPLADINIVFSLVAGAIGYGVFLLCCAVVICPWQLLLNFFKEQEIKRYNETIELVN